ncbi:MAG: SAM-dependent methyltransferase [Sphingomonadales bacterium]|nr:MAG: SAM-dependent methyltransferase [Sphingomonadales bacterium]
MATPSEIIQKLWSLSGVLRDDGMVYHQYMAELTYLLFLKIAQETGTEEALPEGYRWHDLVQNEGEGQLGFYRKMLTHLGEDAPNTQVREIFAFPTTVFKHNANLQLVVRRIDGMDWYSTSRDDFGDIYEGLLEKNAVEAKAGAGQYFTSRALIDSIVSLVKPKAGEICQDPAAGTGGFLISADRYARARSKGRGAHCQGIELVQDTYRLCLMNLFVHGIEGRLVHGDALSDDHSVLDLADVVVTNPPFGTKGGGGAPRRSDLPHATANKQLLFVQHIYRGLKQGGRAAVVLPDNVLFEGNVAQRIRADLMSECDLHTILRLPNGIFYAGVKTNVLFFTRREGNQENSRNIWVYDARTGVPPFGKRTPLTREFFREFEHCFGEDPFGTDRSDETAGSYNRWRRFDRESIRRDADNLDVKWLRDDAGQPDGFVDAEEIAAEITANLQIALSEIRTLTDMMLSAQKDPV